MHSAYGNGEVKAKYYSVIEKFLERGADVNWMSISKSENWLYMPKMADSIRLRIRRDNIFSEATIFPCRYGTWAIKCKKAVDVTRLYSSGTALMMAAQTNNLQVAQLLTQYGTDPTLENEQGETAYSLAKNLNAGSNAFREIVTFLEAGFTQGKLARDKRELQERQEELAKANNAAQRQRQLRIDEIVQRDTRLPPQARKDKYLVALTSRLMDENYEEALFYFELLEQSGAEQDRSFNYFWRSTVEDKPARTGAGKTIYLY